MFMLVIDIIIYYI